ncbi:MAG TPA: nitrite reductase large subunit NirB [Pirellulales bacterium]
MITALQHRPPRETIAVIGNGMVGQRFCQRLVEFDQQNRYRLVIFGEERRPAYDRVALTSFFAHRDSEKLTLAPSDWYDEHEIELHLGDRVCEINSQRHTILSQRGYELAYDQLVIATGSYPFVPDIPGIHKAGVFVYRTIDDLEKIIRGASHAKRCAVLGGGLLGLEAAKAACDLGLETHIVEFAPRLMPRQIDDAGSRILVRKIEALGVAVHLSKSAKAVVGGDRVERLEFADGGALDVEMIIVSAGIRPRDGLGRLAQLTVGQRGGIAVNERLETSQPRIFAIGECALHAGTVYGLVAPGYEMAEVVAANLTGAQREFRGADLSAKLKLLGVDVASFGQHELPPERAVPLTLEDPFRGVYKKLLFSPDGQRLLGGMLVGDAADYGKLLMLSKSDAPLRCPPQELLVGPPVDAPAHGGLDAMPDASQICSCNNVSKGAICAAVSEQGLETLAAVKSCTRAGTGCGGCLPLVADLLKAERARSGKALSNHLCPHFAYSRTELFAIIKVKELRTFADVIADCGSGHGCEICKPAVASILASLWNEDILAPQHQALQDTNDRFLANMQRGGLYSVVPRIAGGEITPDKLRVIAEVGKRYGLYTKITGGQRIDLFGARVQDLPDIWETLVQAGFESGHAYGKAVRTVKSCVGTTWCRYGVQDSVGFAIRVENRYKGIRAPHKIKMAVSGCIRECAEAQSKDVGLIATENGYNLYVCGNGGSKPRHAELLAADLDEDTALRYIDRFLMYYIMTADRLTRTSVWCDKLEGGIEHVRDVVVYDKLGLAPELEARLQSLVDTYQCEWAAVVNDPEKRKWFRQFANTPESEPCIEFVSQREQSRPADWPSEMVALDQFRMLDGRSLAEHEREQLERPRWVHVGKAGDFPIDGGATIKYGASQIAVFNFASRGEWYASQNMCPHKKAFVLSSGMIGDAAGEPKVACPLHKKTFSLSGGQSLDGGEYHIRTFPAKVEGDNVYVELPPVEVLDKLLATEIGCKLATSCAAITQPLVGLEPISA